MKSPLGILCAIAFTAISFAFSVPVLAQPGPVTKWGGVGTGTTTLSYYVVTANGIGTALPKFIDVTSDLSNSICQFYSAGAPLSVTIVSTNGQAVISAPGSTVTTNDVIVVRTMADDAYQRLVVSTSTATNITATGNLSISTAGLAVGDRVYKMTKNGSFSVGAATKQISAGGGLLYAGQQGRPILVETTGTSACAINLVAGTFEK